MHKAVSILILIVFLINTVIPCGLAQGVSLNLPQPGSMVNISVSFVPPILKGINVDPKQPFKFDFILDAGSDPKFSLPLVGRDQGRGELKDEALKNEANKLIRYFLASLTIPEKDLWVNLSPYEKDRIITDEFSQTEMGRDLLSQDYILKQITASLIYPENETGRAFWAKVYAASYEKYGTTNIPVDTFNKVWIIPDKAAVYENGTKAFVTKATLKVMLETDYLAQEKNVVGADLAKSSQGMSARERADIKSVPTDEMTKSIIREIVIPILEKEVNEGANFAQLRQVYYSLILAKWYKETLKESIINRQYSDQKKTNGVDLAGKNDKQMIYEKYLEAFKKGTFNYVKEEYDMLAQETIPKKYFSGGMSLAVHLTSDNSEKISGHGEMIYVKTQLAEPVRKKPRLIFNGKNVQVDEDGFIEGDIHDLGFVEWERNNALVPTIAFDLEGTLVYDEYGTKGNVFLREGIYEQLMILKQRGFRLVLWTTSSKEVTKEVFINRYPQVAEFFDLFITGENSYPVRDRTAVLRELYPDLDEKGLLTLKGINLTNAKDIVLFGYQMLVDNDLEHFYEMAEHPYKERFKIYPIETLHRKGGRENVTLLAQKIMEGIRTKMDQQVFYPEFIEMLQEIEKKDPFLAGQHLYKVMILGPDQGDDQSVLFENIHSQTGLLDISKTLTAPSLKMIKADPEKFLRKFAGDRVTIEKFKNFSPQTQRLSLDIVRLRKGQAGNVIYALGITELSYEGSVPLPEATWLIVNKEEQLITMVQRKTGSVLGGDWEGNSNNYDELAPFTYAWFLNDGSAPGIPGMARTNIREQGLSFFYAGDEWMFKYPGESTFKDFSQSNEDSNINGGIDLNPDHIQLAYKGNKARLEWGGAQLENIEISGLVPVILQVTSMADARVFMESPQR